jgi:hypothetical protein
LIVVTADFTDPDHRLLATFEDMELTASRALNRLALRSRNG